jgi:hypothetical protein
LWIEKKEEKMVVVSQLFQKQQHPRDVTIHTTASGKARHQLFFFFRFLFGRNEIGNKRKGFSPTNHRLCPFL